MNKKKIKQNGSGIIDASIDIVNSMTQLGSSIFTEIKAITNIPKELSNGVVQEPGTPNVMKGPPPYNPPSI
jgi:hypothetical protein